MIQIMLSSLRISSIIHVKSNSRKENKTNTHTHTRECSIKLGKKDPAIFKDLTPNDVQDDRPDGRLGTHIPPWFKYHSDDQYFC